MRPSGFLKRVGQLLAIGDFGCRRNVTGDGVSAHVREAARRYVGETASDGDIETIAEAYLEEQNELLARAESDAAADTTGVRLRSAKMVATDDARLARRG